MGYWAGAMQTIKNADVVIFVLDARMPELSRNKDLEKKLGQIRKETIIVFNKTDLIPLNKLNELKKQNPGSFFISATNKKGINHLRFKLRKIAKALKVENLEVGIVGYPNVGKSALTNALSRTGKAKVSSKAGTTQGPQWIGGAKLKVLDSPGVIPFEDDEIKLGLLGAKNPEKMKNPELVATKIIELFLENSTKNLEELYKIKIEREEDSYDIFVKIGEIHSPLKKGGIINETDTAIKIIRDWQTGKLQLYNLN